MSEMKRALFLGGPKHGQDMMLPSGIPWVHIPYGLPPVSIFTPGEPIDFAKCVISTVDYELRRYVFPNGAKGGGPLIVSVYMTSDGTDARLKLIGTELGKLPSDFRGEPGFWIANRLVDLYDEFIASIVRPMSPRQDASNG